MQTIESPVWDKTKIGALAEAVQGQAAPTFDEFKRAEFVAGKLRAMGYQDVEVDGVPNVYLRIPGQRPGPALLVSAHLDTVFPAETDLRCKREGSKIWGPGIGDNSMGVAGLLSLAQALVKAPPPLCDIWLLANASEEGLGDLQGMRAAIDRLSDRLGACIVIEGSKHRFWPIVHRALGARRYRISARADGGHSWGNFGRSSAIHALVQLAAEIADWKVPSQPRSSFNIGVIEGGTSVNTIAETASLLLDLRSIDAETLEGLDRRLHKLIELHALKAELAGDLKIEVDRVGNRPAGEIPINHPLVEAARAALADAGVPPSEARERISSTDANIPLSRNIPSVTIHLTEGGNAHRLDEWISLDDIPTGMTQLWSLVHRAQTLLLPDPDSAST